MREMLKKNSRRVGKGLRYLITGMLFGFGALIVATVFDRVSASHEQLIAISSAGGPNGSGTVFHRSVTAIVPPEDVYLFGEKIPMQNWDVHERFEREFYYNYTNADQLLLWYKRSQRWFPVVEKELNQAGLPTDLKYIMVAESGIRNVQSPAAANGFWQFIPGTGTRFGLRVDNQIDERLDPVKATDAAMSYLKTLKSQLGQWTLVAAAYNMGEAGVQRLIEEQHQDTYWNLYMNEETMRYVFRIAAIKELMEHGDRYGLDFRSVKGYRLPEVTKTIVQGPVSSLADWAYSKGFAYKDVKVFNPWIVGKGLPSGSFTIDLPARMEDRTTVQAEK